MSIVAADEGNVVYVGLGACEGLYYRDRDVVHGCPIVLKIGKSAKNLERRYKEHARVRGFKILATLGVIRRPADGVHNCESALKAHLEPYRLVVGTVDEFYRPMLECYEPSPATINAIADFMEENRRKNGDDYELSRDDEDPLDVARDLLVETYGENMNVTAVEVADGFTPEEVFELKGGKAQQGRDLSDPRLIANAFVRDHVEAVRASQRMLSGLRLPGVAQ